MRIARVEIEKFRGELPEPAWNAQTEWPSREGILLRLFDETGLVGQGEASPLGDYSPDAPGKCEETLANLAPTDFPEFDLERSIPQQVLGAFSLVAPNTPAATFALETALLDLIGRRLEKPVAAIVRSRPQTNPVPLSALIQEETPEKAREETRHVWDRGIRCIKVKAGRPGRFEEELALLRELRGAFGEQLSIRVDVNGAWNLVEAEDRLSALVEIGPEFVEQPVAPHLLLKLGASPVPVAADETVMLPGGVERLSLVPACRILVLKPMVLGGILQTLRIARLAQARRYEVVVSHLLDGPIALTAAIALVHCLPFPPLPCGLDRHVGLTIWPSAAIPGLGRNDVQYVEHPGLGLEPIGNTS